MRIRRSAAAISKRSWRPRSKRPCWTTNRSATGRRPTTPSWRNCRRRRSAPTGISCTRRRGSPSSSAWRHRSARSPTCTSAAARRAAGPRAGSRTCARFPGCSAGRSHASCCRGGTASGRPWAPSSTNAAPPGSTSCGACTATGRSCRPCCRTWTWSSPNRTWPSPRGMRRSSRTMPCATTSSDASSPSGDSPAAACWTSPATPSCSNRVPDSRAACATASPTATRSTTCR